MSNYSEKIISGQSEDYYMSGKPYKIMMIRPPAEFDSLVFFSRLFFPHAMKREYIYDPKL